MSSADASAPESDRTGSPSTVHRIGRVLGAVAVGVVLALVLPVLAFLLEAHLLALVAFVVSPLAGGAVAGYLSEGGTVLGIGSGLVVGVLTPSTWFAVFFGAILPDMSPTVGSGFAAAFVLAGLLVYAILGFVLGPVGGYLGVVHRERVEGAASERRRDEGEPDRRGGEEESGRRGEESTSTRR